VLAQLGGKQAVASLLTKLDDQDSDVRQTVIEALAQLGDKEVVAPLLTKLVDQDPNVGVTAALAIKALGDPEGGAALTRFLTADEAELRQAAVRIYARHKEFTDQLLLSHDLDASDPWLDPSKPVSDVQVAKAVSRLEISPEQVRSRFEIIAGELNLKLDWKP
jgi:HEAT repeat protein